MWLRCHIEQTGHWYAVYVPLYFALTDSSASFSDAYCTLALWEEL